MNKWIKCDKSPFNGERTLKGYEDLGNVIATTKFESGDKQLYVYKSVRDKSFIFMVKDKNDWINLSCIPEEVIENMVGTIVFGDKIY